MMMMMMAMMIFVIGIIIFDPNDLDHDVDDGGMPIYSQTRQRGEFFTTSGLSLGLTFEL